MFVYVLQTTSKFYKVHNLPKKLPVTKYYICIKTLIYYLLHINGLSFRKASPRGEAVELSETDEV